MEKRVMGKECHGELPPGGVCNICGASRSTEAESAATLESAQQAPFDKFAGKFSGNVEELTAMIDIRFRVNYPTWNQEKTDEMVRRIEAGELPSKLVLET